MTDNFYEGKQGVINGVIKAAKILGSTMGTSGSNVLIECIERPGHFVTNDGETILKNLRFTDPQEEIGRQILYEAVSRANKRSGDGSTTTAVLTSSILEEGMKHIDNFSPMEIKNSLEACIPVIEESINSQKKIITLDDVHQVASISAEDEGIGQTIEDIYKKIGKDGVISWDISKTPEDSYTIGTGLTVHGATYTSPHMCDKDSSEIRLKNPNILLVRKKITTALDFESLFRDMNSRDQKEIVVFCDDIDVQVISDLLMTQRVQGFRTVVVRMPLLWRDEWWEDLALASGGTVIDEASGIKLVESNTFHLGSFENITITKEDAYIDGIQDLSKHILALKVEGSDKSLLRASRLNTKTARYFVGAHSESALTYRRLKVEDAINAASCALENGVVPGGGLALRNCAYPDTVGEDVGGLILCDSLRNPFETIVNNCGRKWEDLEGIGGVHGFNSKTGKVEDLMKAGIVDPMDVVINAIKSAIGVAASILTIGNVVTLVKEDKPSPPMPPFMR